MDNEECIILILFYVGFRVLKRLINIIMKYRKLKLLLKY